MSSLFGSLETTKLDKVDVVDPSTATEDGKAADAKKTQEELNRVLAKLAKKADSATTLAGYGITDAATKAEIAAKADLAGGKVPAAQLPSYVDDVLEYGSKSEFPASGESGKIYVAKDTNLVYRWSGTQYVEISPSPVLDDTVTEASSNGVKSSGIWSWVKSLLPQWLTSDYAEPATVESVAAKADASALNTVAENAEAAYNVATGIASTVYSHVDNRSNPHAVTAAQIGAYTRAETDAKLDAKRDKTDLSVYDFKFRFDFGDSGIVSCYEPEWNEDGYWYTLATDGDGKDYGCYAWGEKERDSYSFDVIGEGPSNGKTFTGFRDVKYKTTDTIATTNGVNASIAANEKTGTDEQIVRGTLLDGGRYWEISVLHADTADFAKELASEYWTEPAGVSGRPTTLSGYGITDAAKLAMLLPPAFAEKTSGSYEEGEIVLYNNEAYKRNDTAGDDTSWVAAHWTSAADADLAARLKCLKNDGFATDEFATNLLGKPVANIKANSSAFAPEYDATSAYSVGSIVYHDGNIYQCKTAIAEGGETWNAEHWELRKLDGFFTESNSLLTGTIDARLPYPLYAVPSTGILKDRAINTTSLSSVTVPENFTDLLVRASVATSLPVTMPDAITKYGDTFPDAAGEYLITITKTGAAEAYVRVIKLEVANA